MLTITLAEMYKSISRARTPMFSARTISSFVRINFILAEGFNSQIINTSAILQIMKGEGSCVPIKPSTHVRKAVTRPGINPNENVTAAVNIVSINNGIFNSNTAKRLKKRLMTAAKTQSRVIAVNRFAVIFNMEESLS